MYHQITAVYPSVTQQELDEAKSHPEGHFEGIVNAISRRTGEAAHAVRAKLEGLLHRQS
jgi:hypothetical protein